MGGSSYPQILPFFVPFLFPRLISGSRWCSNYNPGSQPQTWPIVFVRMHNQAKGPDPGERTGSLRL